MSDYGVTSSGFVVKRLADIIDSLKTRLQAVTDSQGNTISIDLEDSSVISQIVSLVAEDISECWEMGSAIATQFDPRYSTGQLLSGVVQLNGIFRKSSAPTQLNLTLSGTNGTVIPKGSLVATSDNEHTFKTDDDATIASGTASVSATSTETVVVTVANSASMNIQNPLPGWTGVICASTAVVGSSEETDETLRERQQVSTQYTAQRESEAIQAAVANVDGVTFAKLYENPTDTTDAKSIAARSICVVAYGGTNADIADAIYNKASCITGTSGNTTVTVEETDVKFTRPSTVAIHINVTIKNNGVGFPSTTYEQDVKDAILSYTASSATGYNPGETVYATQLSCPVNQIAGVAVSAITVKGAEVSYGSSAAIAWNEIATFSSANITVTLA